MGKNWLAIAGALILAAIAGPAFAQAADTSVTVPWGSMVQDVALAAIAAVGAAVVGAFRFLPAHVRWALTVFQAEQLIEKALAHARATVNEEVATKSWTVDLRSKAIANAVNYGVAHYAGLVKKLGGSELFRQKLEARLQEFIEKAVGR